jgi:hypothetical protein
VPGRVNVMLSHMNRILRAATATGTTLGVSIATAALMSAPAEAYTVDTATPDVTVVTLDQADISSVINTTNGADRICTGILMIVPGQLGNYQIPTVNVLNCATVVLSCSVYAVQLGKTSVQAAWYWDQHPTCTA